MRIVFLNPVGFLGGAERVLLDCIASLKQTLPADATMRLICLSEGPLADEARALGIEAETFPLPAELSSIGESGLGGGRIGRAARLGLRMAAASPAAMKFIHQFRKTIASAQADVIHSNGLKTHLLTRLLPTSSGRVVWHIHDLLGQRAMAGSALRHAAGHVSSAIAISQAVANELKTVLPKTPVTTVLNGIDTDHFSPAPGDGEMLDRLAGLPIAPAETVRVGLVATYARWKGQDLFIEAAVRLRRQPNAAAARFYIIGGSIYHTAGSQFSKEELQAQAAAAGIADSIGFIGFQSDPMEIYRALDVVIHASTKPEPFGRTIAEAMACGRAVIVSKAGGAVELFDDGVDAIGMIPGNADSLAEAMRGLIVDRGRRQALGEAARQTAVTRFSRERLGPELLAIYKAALD